MKVTIIDYGAGNVPSVERALDRLGAKSERTGSPEDISKARVLLLPGVGHYSALVRAHVLFIQRANQRDRKSTRLNSSHLGISYAVFCLKKKILAFFIFGAMGRR